MYTSPELTPVKAALSKVTLGDALRVCVAITILSGSNNESRPVDRSILDYALGSNSRIYVRDGASLRAQRRIVREQGRDKLNDIRTGVDIFR